VSASGFLNLFLKKIVTCQILDVTHGIVSDT